MPVQISIIVPVLNEIEQIQKNSGQYRELLNAEIELIFVDGGSTDGSLEYLQLNFRNVYITASGRARQMNKGAEFASGDVLLFLHVDTQLPALSKMQNVILPDISWGFFQLKLSGPQRVYRIIEQSIRFRSWLFNVATGDQVLVLKKSFFEQMGGFPQLELMEDIAISRLAKKYARPVKLNAEVTSSSRRWEHYGPIKTCVYMWYIQLLYKFGVSTSTLNKLYRAGKWI